MHWMLPLMLSSMLDSVPGSHSSSSSSRLTNHGCHSSCHSSSSEHNTGGALLCGNQEPRGSRALLPSIHCN